MIPMTEEIKVDLQKLATERNHISVERAKNIENLIDEILHLRNELSNIKTLAQPLTEKLFDVKIQSIKQDDVPPDRPFDSVSYCMHCGAAKNHGICIHRNGCIMIKGIL